jgi:very-short-patch-repair endonuclease
MNVSGVRAALNPAHVHLVAGISRSATAGQAAGHPSGMTVPGWPVAFRGSRAVAAGLVTRDGLRGPRFRRLLPDVYCRAAAEPDLLLRSLAAYRLVERRGVLSGYSAAALLGAGCAPRPDVPAEVTVPGGGLRSHPALTIYRDRLAADEVTRVRDIACTTPLRTAFDLARQTDADEAVVAVDRLANRHRFHPDLLLGLYARHRGRRGVARVPRAVARANPYSGSPMETRLRLLIVAGGLPCPEVQWVVQDPATRTAFWLDLAWPELMIGIEYDGEPHTEAPRVLRDIARSTRLLGLGWRVYRYTKLDVRRDPARIVAELIRARAR